MESAGTRLAELNVRHTRRHMPVRRVALEPSYLPTAGGAAGSDLLAAVVAEFAPRIDEETRVRVPWLLRRVGDGGLEVPSIHLHHRLQTDTHGLDRSRHRLLDDGRGTVLELDVHAHPEPQVLAVCMAIAAMPSVARAPAIDARSTRLAGTPFGAQDPYGVGLPKGSDGVAFINAFLKKLEADGTWAKLWTISIGQRTGSTTVPAPPALP